MDLLERHVRWARRRLGIQRFLRALTWCWFGALCLAVAPLAIDIFVPLGIARGLWITAALSLGLVSAAIWAWGAGRGRLDAAVEIDRRLGLKERIASAVSLSDEQQQSPLAPALVADAAARLERLDLRDGFRLNPWHRWAWLPLVPAAVTFALVLLGDPLAQRRAEAARQEAEAQKQIKTSTDHLRRKLAERRKQVAEGLPDSEHLFAELERAAEELQRRGEPDRRETLVKLNDLAKQIDLRRRELGGNEQLREQLAQLPKTEQGPAERLTEALRNQDLRQAIEELKRLNRRLAEGELDPHERQRLAEQLEQIGQKLEQRAEARRQQQQELERRLAEAHQQGRRDEARRLEEQLEQLRRQDAQDQRARQVAANLEHCAKCLREGRSGEARAQLEALEENFARMDLDASEIEALELAWNDLDECKNALQCQACGGEGCEDCQGDAGDRHRTGGGRGGGIGNQPGNRPLSDHHLETGAYDSRVRQKVRPGEAVVTDMVEGPNIRGEIQQEIAEEMAAARSAESEPQLDQPLPRSAREHVRKYFEALREGR